MAAVGQTVVVMDPLKTYSSSRLRFTLAKDKPFVVGHRGASDSYPENTILAFEKAIADGANAIEFDINKTKDNEILILHDSSLNRTTTGQGLICDSNYHGDLENVTTKESPHCHLPRFGDVIDLLMKEGNSHVWGVIDVKPENPPGEIFQLLRHILLLRNPDMNVFSKRIILGIWHPIFLPHARSHLPEIPIVHIGQSLQIARKYFSDVDGYNLLFLTLASSSGQRFLQNAHQEGKPVYVWTVNEEPHAKNCYKWGVDAVMTDKPRFLLDYFASDKPKVASGLLSNFFRNVYYWAMTWLNHFMFPRHLLQYGRLDS